MPHYVYLMHVLMFESTAVLSCQPIDGTECGKDRIGAKMDYKSYIYGFLNIHWSGIDTAGSGKHFQYSTTLHTKLFILLFKYSQYFGVCENSSAIVVVYFSVNFTNVVNNPFT